MGVRHIPSPEMAACDKQKKETIEENESSSEDVTGLKAMSPLRLAAFIFSILLSLTTTSLFLWALPCDTYTCVAERFNDTLVGNYSSSFSSSKAPDLLE